MEVHLSIVCAIDCAKQRKERHVPWIQPVLEGTVGLHPGGAGRRGRCRGCVGGGRGRGHSVVQRHGDRHPQGRPRAGHLQRHGRPHRGRCGPAGARGRGPDRAPQQGHRRGAQRCQGAGARVPACTQRGHQGAHARVARPEGRRLEHRAEQRRGLWRAPHGQPGQGHGWRGQVRGLRGLADRAAAQRLGRCGHRPPEKTVAEDAAGVRALRRGREPGRLLPQRPGPDARAKPTALPWWARSRRARGRSWCATA